MVTVAIVAGNSGKIALAKPHLINQIVEKLLMIENISVTPHLTKECKLVIAEYALKSIDLFFPQIKQKNKVIKFVKRYVGSSRKTLQNAAEEFLKKYGQSV